jgi:cytidylate kinase
LSPRPLDTVRHEVPPDTVVAIDGPAGSGKSTTARALAERLGLLYVDTGAMYRALTWAAARAGVDAADGPALAALLGAADMRLDVAGGETSVAWNGRDISAEIRSPDVEAAVSAVSAHPEVRRALVKLQRAMGRQRGVVMEGRDIGSVVFPLATAKIYLDASLEARASRRLRQHRRRGVEIDFEAVRLEVAERDRKDSGRAESPLCIPPDAMVIDNSELGPAEQLDVAAEYVLMQVEEKRPYTGPPLGLQAVTFRYKVAFSFFCAIGRFMALKVYGRGNLGYRRGIILAPNHISNWDPPILGAALADLAPMRSVAKEELFKNPFSRAMYLFLDAIPIKRSIYDAGAFDRASAFLEAGANVLFYPEGMRRVFGAPGPVRNGLGMIAQRTGAPIVPAFYRGTLAPLPGGSPRGPVEVWFAPPVRLHALPTLRRSHSEREINKLIARLFERIYLDLQERSFSRIPMTDWERDAAARQVEQVRRKEAKTFKRRPTPGRSD